MPRMTYNHNEKMETIMSNIIQSELTNEVTKSGVINNALVFYERMIKELEKGNQVAITDDNDKVIKTVIFAF